MRDSVVDDTNHLISSGGSSNFSSQALDQMTLIAALHPIKMPMAGSEVVNLTAFSSLLLMIQGPGKPIQYGHIVAHKLSHDHTFHYAFEMLSPSRSIITRST